MQLQLSVVTPHYYCIEDDKEMISEPVESKIDLDVENLSSNTVNLLDHFLLNEFLSTHLFSFLCLRDISNMDTAFTNNIYRSMWSAIPKKLFNDHLLLSTPTRIEWCIKRNVFLMDVALSPSILSNTKNIKNNKQQIIHQFKHCQKLTLTSFCEKNSDTIVSISEFSNIIQNVPMLMKLCLEKCESFQNSYFMDIALANVSQNCPLLETIELYNVNITNRTLSEVGKLHCLRDFSYYNDEKLNINVNNLSQEGINQLITSKYNNNSNNTNNSNNNNIKNNNNSNNSNNNSNNKSPLERVHIVIHSKKSSSSVLYRASSTATAATITESNANMMAKYCPELQSLSLLMNNKSMMSNSSISYLVKNCKQLYRINESFDTVKRELEKEEEKEGIIEYTRTHPHHSRNNIDDGIATIATTANTSLNNKTSQLSLSSLSLIARD